MTLSTPESDSGFRVSICLKSESIEHRYNALSTLDAEPMLAALYFKHGVCSESAYDHGWEIEVESS
jgi:hypothetical protein